MKSLDQFFQSDIVNALGWTIIHSFWQGLLIVLLLTVGLVILRRQSSRLRYLAGYVALLALTLSSGYTFFHTLSQRSVDTPAGQIPAPGALTDLSAIPVSAPVAYVEPGQGFWQAFLGFMENNVPLITLVWMLGVLILTLRFLAELAYIQRLKHQPGQLSAGAFQDLVNDLCKRMGIKKLVELKENIRISSPMVIGFVKPVILMPFGLLTRLDTAQIESILAHELAHIRRYDYIFNLFQSLVEIVLFFNPATWWLSSFIRSEREFCCDDMAVRQTGNKLVFVQTLAKLEEYRTLPGNVALAFNGRRDSGVLGRVKRIVNNEEQFRVPYKLFWSCLILLGSLGLFAFQGQPDLSPLPVEHADKIPQAEGIPAAPDLPAEGAPADQPGNQEIPKGIDTEETPNAAGPESGLRLPGLEPAGSHWDSLPEGMKKIRQEMMRLEKSYMEQEMAMQKQGRDIQTTMMKLKREMQEIENSKMKELFELEKNAQEIEMQRNIQMKELEIEHNGLEGQALELDYKMQELETQMNGKEGQEELRKQREDLVRQRLGLEKKKRELELSQKRNELTTEKEMQLLNNKRWELQKEVEISKNDQQLKVMELEGQMQEIDFKNQLLQSERQNQLRLLEQQMQQEAEKWNGEK
ncbi:MAG TPA: M56 family metallopeptidase [Flavilitoribacter sp.]|nr:M56 family metallopeptidase [Flavilitoribacter sp.]HMQ89806.1 M56 family metallopeptidase [Flavilitoribacter sp.]